MLDLQHSAYGSLSRLQIRRDASPGSFFCQRDNCGRSEYRQFSASHCLCGQFFCDDQFSITFDSCCKHCFLQSGAAEAAPCFLSVIVAVNWGFGNLAAILESIALPVVCTSFALLLPPRLLIPRILIPHFAPVPAPGQILVEVGDLPCWN